MSVNINDKTVASLVQTAWNIRKSNFPDTIEFDVPDQTRTVSVTGNKCILNCAHCGGHYLKNMTPISDVNRISDYSSLLISGGCDEMGKVDIAAHKPLIDELKENSIKINAHVGLISEEQIRKVASFADCVSFDFLTDKETIQQVYGLGLKPEDYIDTYLNLKKHVRVVPHICIGLYGGKLQGEIDAIKKLKELGADSLVFIVFIPTPGTRYADKPAPSPEDVAKVLATARIEFPDIPIHLGCMRPKGKIRAQIDQLAVLCGVNKLVNPTRPAVEEAQKCGLEVKYGRECCVL
ncbi:MAG: radical SAM protein [Peptoclostridium sp.]|uniref:radical SAM protein n=1 Tax=Peptoclostridium sp. TaxID=1904860 RepID=UPI00139B5A43|nr:radical SAM protein [Peptoclostridium sp.]MZQ75474.1 radical SAM protein [Peptoclostridium sp.]